MRRAVMISNVLDAHVIEKSRMAEALDAVRCAVLLVDERGTVLHANESAEHMLRDGSFIHVTDDVLAAKSPSAASEFRSALSLAARDEVDIGKTGLAIRLTEPDAPPVFAHVLPLTGSDARTRLQSTAIAAVFIGGLADQNEAAEMTAAAFGLTPAETRVLSNLLGGLTMAEIAAVLEISATTARTHLDNIFSKTGVKRQAELVRLGLGLVPPAASKIHPSES